MKTKNSHHDLAAVGRWSAGRSEEERSREEGGSGRHAVICGRLREGSTCLDPHRLVNLLLLALLPRQTMWGSVVHDVWSDIRRTRAVGGVQLVSGSVLDPLVGALKKGRKDSSSPRHTARITTRLTRQLQARAAQAPQRSSAEGPAELTRILWSD